eukprot:335899-Chlamydomonas_euryale.AAC.2
MVERVGALYHKSARMVHGVVDHKPLAGAHRRRVKLEARGRRGALRHRVAQLVRQFCAGRCRRRRALC